MKLARGQLITCKAFAEDGIDMIEVPCIVLGKYGKHYYTVWFIKDGEKAPAHSCILSTIHPQEVQNDV